MYNYIYIMAIPRLFRTPKPKAFEFKPRFYDAEKEAREERFKNIDAEQKGESHRGMLRRGAFRQSMDRKQPRQYQPITRILLIIAALMAIAYLLLR